MVGTQDKIDPQTCPIEQIFQMFSSAAMSPRKYKEKPLPHSVTVTIRPEYMEILHVIACRIGTSRSNVARHILEMGAVEAASGCGFTVNEDQKIPESEKGNWDLAPRPMGFSHIPANEED